MHRLTRLTRAIPRPHNHPRQPRNCVRPPPFVSLLDTRSFGTASDKDLPPMVLWSHESEFKHSSNEYLIRFKILRRIGLLAMDRVFSGQTAMNLFVFGSGVYTLGLIEAGLVVNMEALPRSDFVQFMHAYASANMIPSCVWTSIPPGTVAHAIGLDPVEALNATYHHESYLDIIITNIASVRSILAGFGILSQVLRIVNISMEAGSLYRKRVLDGREPIFRGVPQRFLRLCGRDSQVTVTTLHRCGEHIIPILEDQTNAKAMMHKCLQWDARGDPFHEFQVAPQYIHVAQTGYGAPHMWRCLANIDASFLLTTTTGRSILCMEADATSQHDPMGLLREGGGNDLQFDDAAQSFKQIDRIAEKAGLRFRTLRVYLGNQSQTFRSGGGFKYSLRDRLKNRDEVDIVLDSGAPILKAALKWCQKVVHAPGSNQADEPPAILPDDKTVFPWKPNKEVHGTILLETSSVKYFQALSQLFKEQGMNVVDAAEYDQISGSNEDEDAYTLLPRIIIHSDEAESVNAVYALVESKRIDLKKCCVIVQSEETAELLDEIIDESREQFKVICSAQIYDDMFRQVRTWARLGYTPPSIQARVDMLYGYFYDRPMVAQILPADGTTR